MAVTASLQGRGRKGAFDNVAASQTDSVLVAAVAGKKVRVIAFVLNGADAGASTFTFNSKPAGAGTAISPAFKVTNNTVLTVSDCSTGWFESNVGEGLTCTTAAASATGVSVIYELVSA